jgi:hypothetical protein
MHTQLLSLDKLEASTPENLLRLARSLYINAGGMTHMQLANCVHSRLMFPALRSPKQRSEYVILWEDLTA